MRGGRRAGGGGRRRVRRARGAVQPAGDAAPPRRASLHRTRTGAAAAGPSHTSVWTAGRRHTSRPQSEHPPLASITPFAFERGKGRSGQLMRLR
jgi:hypothetical protein